MKIEIASIEDLPGIIDIYNQAINAGNATADLTELKAEDRLEWFNNHPKDYFPIYVIREQDKIIGWGSLSPYRHGRAALQATAEISFYIDYSYHGKGLGKKLIEYMIGDCKRLGIKNVFAVLLEINKASVIVLEKTGFERWGYLPKIAILKDKVCGQFIYGRNLE